MTAPLDIHDAAAKSADESDGADYFCPNCGYSLRGITSDRCPECGDVLDWKALGASRIPWMHRKHIGVFAAYWRTVWLTMTDSRLISDDVQRPVSFDDAQKFRRLTVWIAWAPLALAASAGLLLLTFDQSTGGVLDAWKNGPRIVRLSIVLQLLLVPICCLSLYLFVLAITGVQSYFFHPRSLPVLRQNRAVALSYYACAPLAWTPVTAALIGGYFGVVSTGAFNKLPVTLMLITWVIASILVFGLALLQTVGWWISTLRLLARTTQCGAGRRWTMGFLLPVSWVLLFAIIGVGIPAAFVYCCFVVLSLM